MRRPATMDRVPGQKSGGADPDERDSYWALLRAVPRTVAQHGFRGLTYRAVAKEAGLTYGMITHHFGTREALIREAASLAVNEAIMRSIAISSSQGLEDFPSGFSELISEERPAQIFQYELVFEALRSDDLLAAVREHYDRYVSAAAEALTELGIDADAPLARTVLATLDGLVLQQLIYGDSERTDESIAALRRLLAALDPARLSN